MHNLLTTRREMNTSKPHVMFAMAMVAVMLLAACGAPSVVRETVEVPVQQTVVVPVELEQFPDGTPLHILQWSHFVPQYDVWFDPFAQAWGGANGVDVTVDHIALAGLPASLTAAIDAGEGPGLVEVGFSPPAFLN